MRIVFYNVDEHLFLRRLGGSSTVTSSASTTAPLWYAFKKVKKEVKWMESSMLFDVQKSRLEQTYHAYKEVCPANFYNTNAPLTVLAHACADPAPTLKSALQGVRKYPSDSTHT